MWVNPFTGEQHHDAPQPPKEQTTWDGVSTYKSQGAIENPFRAMARNQTSQLAQQAYASQQGQGMAGFANALRAMNAQGSQIGNQYAAQSLADKEARSRALAAWMKERHQRQMALDQRKTQMWKQFAGAAIGGAGAGMAGAM